MYYSIALKGAQFTSAVTNKVKPIDATNNTLKHNLPGIDSSNLQGNFQARILICSFEEIKFLMFLFQILSRQACLTLCRSHAAWHLSWPVPITLKHTIIHRSLFN